jgi:hypothetical protein
MDTPPSRSTLEIEPSVRTEPRPVEAATDRRPPHWVEGRRHDATLTRSAQTTVEVPSADIDLESWLFALSDEDYQACARGHRAAGVFTDEHGRGSVNVESIGGNLLIQHYRLVRGRRSHVEMFSAASRVYLLHLIPVVGAVRWTLTVTPRTRSSSALTCTVEVGLHPVLGILGRLMAVGAFLQRHVTEEMRGFAADITRKHAPHAR